MNRNSVNNMINSIDEKMIIEASQKKNQKKIRWKSIMIGTAACICLVSGTIYFLKTPYTPLVQYGMNVSYEGINMYYEQESLSRLELITLGNKKGEKIAEFCDNDVKWYKLKDSNSIYHIIQDNGTELTKWKFVNYKIEENCDLDIHWIIKNIFSINSENDIIDIMIDDNAYKIDNDKKEKLYNDLLSLKYPVTEEDLMIMENISVHYTELHKIKIRTKNETLNFVIDQDNNILKLDEGVYSFFTVMTDNYFQADSSGINLDENTPVTRTTESFLDFESDAESITEQSPCP